MATRERREEYSANVVRVLHPSRPLSPGTNVSNIDNNLDNLLEDLQSSVSPGNGNVRNYSTNRDVQYLSPANATTIVKERSVSPNSETRRVYKTSSYQYSAGDVPVIGGQQNVNQLDTLLQDLKTERQVSRDKDYSRISSPDSGRIEPGGTSVTKTTRVYTTNSSLDDNKPNVQRELFFDSPDSGVTRNSKTRQKSPVYTKTFETKTVKDVSYEPVVPETEKIITTNTTKRYNYSTTPERVISPTPYSKTISLDATELPDDLKGVPLSDDILPVPGTKVTTTVRTYTYEIPSEPTGTLNKTLLYKNELYNTTNGTGYPPERDVPQTVVFKTESYTNNTTNNDGYPSGQEQPPPSTIHKTILHKRDVRETSTNSYPDQPPNGYPTGSGAPRYDGHPPSGPNKTVIYKQDITNTTNTSGPPSYDRGHPPSGPNTTIIYKENVTNTTNTIGPPRYDRGHPPSGPNTTIIYKEDVTNTTNTSGPPRYDRGHPPSGPNTTIIYKEDVTNTTNTNVHPGSPNYRPNGPHSPHSPTGGYPGSSPNGPNTTYYYKHESTNTKNTLYGPPGGDGNPPPPHDKTTHPIITYPNNSSPNHGPPHHNYPREPNVVTYKYSSTSNTTNNTSGYPNESEPLLQPIPFPTDDVDTSVGQNGNPPKRLDDLLATLGPNDGRPLADEPYTPRKEIETGVATSGKQVIPSKNIAGPPVYYPPGQEMFARKEESGAALRAQGGYARAAGKYEYEAEAKSKSKSRSGATMVPVCLPLCCAMPCTIM